MIYEEAKDDFLISTDRSKLDLPVIHTYLSNESYWAANIPIETVQRSIDHSFCFGLYHQNAQIGFARVITDHATYAYLADVFTLQAFRGRGLSKWLMAFIMSNPELQGLRRWGLATRDAHALYTGFGFTPLSKPNRLMEKINQDIYKKKEAG